MEIKKKVAVIGAGTMGTGIVYLCATKGYKVSIRDISENLVKREMVKEGHLGVKTRKGSYKY